MKENKSKRFIVTTGEELHKKIMTAAKDLGISGSDFIRMSVNEKLMKVGDKNGTKKNVFIKDNR